MAANRILLAHEQALSPLEDRRADAVAGEGSGVCRQGSPGAVRVEPGGRGDRSGGDRAGLPRRSGSAAVRSGDDDGAFALRLLQRGLLVAADRQGLPGTRRLHEHSWARPPGFPHDLGVPQASSERVVGTFRPGVAPLRAGRAGQARPCRTRWDEGQGQRLQAQSHELRADGQAGGGIGSRGRRLDGRRGEGGRQRGRRLRTRQERRGDAGLGRRQEAARREDPRRQGRTGGRGESRRRSRAQSAGRGEAARNPEDPPPHPQKTRTRKRRRTSPIPKAAS